MAVPIAGCAGADASRIAIAWTVDPGTPAAGAPVVVRLTMTDDGQPVRGAVVRVEAHMAHPGMAPVLAAVDERGDGAYEARLRFTMAGDWILVLDGELADGRRILRQVDVAGVQPVHATTDPAGASP